MTDEVAGNYIRAFRRKCKFSQRELGILIGYPAGDSVGRHERSETAPPFLIALAYEVVFDIPVGQIFTGFRAVVAQGVVRNGEELREEIEKVSDNNKFALEKLEWLARLRQHIEGSATFKRARDN